MKFKERIKTYKFWVALSASIIVFLKSFEGLFGFKIPEQIVNDIIMAFCGILVVLGVVDKTPFDTKKQDFETKQDLQENVKENIDKDIK